MEDFKQLIDNIQITNDALQQQAVNAINQALSIRNWLIGFYIVEYEQNGKDRAEYGKKLLKKLAEKLIGIKGLDERSLRNFRRFYLFYPNIGSYLDNYQIRGTLPPIFKQLLIRGTASPESGKSSKTSIGEDSHISSDEVLSRLSYSHIEMLLKIDNSLKRTFYELETIKAVY